MFIVSGKSHCCKDTFTNIRFISLLAKNIKKNTNYFYAVRISTSLAILSEMFVQIGYFFTSYARKQKWLFFSEHSVEFSLCLKCVTE